MNLDAIDVICRDYVMRHRKRADQELRYYAVQRTDEEAVSRAALARLPSGKRHPHQYRVPRTVLEESRSRLVANIPQLKASRSFDDLFHLVRELIGPINGIGELAIYDTALRIGARFGLAPERVYLHAGTREGARLLGVDNNNDSVEMNQLPRPLQNLSAREAEDLLCIYKGRLAVVR
jgi:hypothetical protein